MSTIWFCVHVLGTICVLTHTPRVDTKKPLVLGRGTLGFSWSVQDARVYAEGNGKTPANPWYPSAFQGFGFLVEDLCGSACIVCKQIQYEQICMKGTLSHLK
jgi:hypothetical protein